jgi:hypothetical protein
MFLILRNKKGRNVEVYVLKNVLNWTLMVPKGHGKAFYITKPKIQV